MTPRSIAHIIMLIAAMQMLSGFKWRCYWFCTDQTGIQTDYVESRDTCRKYAQLRIDTDTSSPDLSDERERKSKLIALFSSCMGEKGWTVPDGKSGQQPAAAIPVPTPGASAAAAAGQTAQPAPQTAPAVVAAPMPAANSSVMTPEQSQAVQQQQRERSYIARQSECAFARHGAAYSSTSATRAKACDMECEQKKTDDPTGRAPAACQP